MEPWQFLVALIQGLVEWLPISSSGQTILVLYNAAEVPIETAIHTAVWLHLGTAAAVIVRYRSDFISIITIADRALVKHLIVATAATAVTGVPTYFLILNLVRNGEFLNLIVGLSLIITSQVVRASEKQTTAETCNAVVSDRNALIAGLMQGFSVIPGLSRSGVTIATLLGQRVDKEHALKFSFLMSVPAVLGILVLEALIGAQSPIIVSVSDLFLMQIVVFLTGLASMEFLLRLARRVSMAVLCLTLGVIALVIGLPGLF
ncbi:MAG: undecaprenyl-diphosphate phosphatase [Candidatus Thorarchaeota archaeon]